jgi:hypothetical protein
MSSPTLEATEIMSPSFLVLGPGRQIVHDERVKKELIKALMNVSNVQSGNPPQSFRNKVMVPKPRILGEPGVGALERATYYHYRTGFSIQRMSYFWTVQLRPENLITLSLEQRNKAAKMETMMIHDQNHNRICFYDADLAKAEHMAACLLDPLDIGGPAKAYPSGYWNLSPDESYPRGFQLGALSKLHPTRWTEAGSSSESTASGLASELQGVHISPPDV